MENAKAVRTVGLLAAIAGFIFTGPGTWTQIWQNTQAESVQNLSLMYHSTLIANFLLWAMYGKLKKDNFVMIPNAVGFLGGLAILFQFWLYR